MLELAVATSPHRNPEHACRTKSAGLPSDIPFTTLFPTKEVEEEEEKSEDEEEGRESWSGRSGAARRQTEEFC